jgi:hypothetical protein
MNWVAFLDQLRSARPDAHEINPPCPIQRIIEMERDLGPLPATLREMLAVFNGARLFIAGMPSVTVFGLSLRGEAADHDWYIDRYTPAWRKVMRRESDFVIGYTIDNTVNVIGTDALIRIWDTEMGDWSEEEFNYEEWARKIVSDGVEWLAESDRVEEEWANRGKICEPPLEVPRGASERELPESESAVGQNADKNLRIGDWVRVSSPGIWRIYRILRYKHAAIGGPGEADQTTVFAKRFVSNSFKRSFSEGCWHPSLVSKLDSKDFERLTGFIEANGRLHELFERYEPKPLNSVYNARIRIPEDRSAAEVAALFDRSQLIRETDIKSLLTRLGFDTETFPCWTVQFISEDHRCLDDYIVYRFHRVIED